MNNILSNPPCQINDFFLEGSSCKIPINWERLWMLRLLEQRWCGVRLRHFIWWYYKSMKTWKNQLKRKLEQLEEKLEEIRLKMKDKEAVEQDLREDQELTWQMTKCTWLKTFKSLKRNCLKNIWKHYKMSMLKVKTLIEEVIMDNWIEEWAKIWIQMFH